MKTKVAIIGLGNIGKIVASNLVQGNHPITVASRELDKATNFAAELGELAVAKDTLAAIHDADVVIPAIPFGQLKDFFAQYASALQGKIIVDVSNPIGPDGKGGLQKIIDKAASAGEILAGLAPTSANLVKAFGTLGAGSLKKEAFANPRKVLFYASDNTNDNKIIEALIIDSGFEPLHVGGIKQSIAIEVFGDLHEFGRLGKAVTLDEAKEALRKH